MPKVKTAYSCTECGGQCSKWQGQCPHCNAWNTLVETIAAPRTARFQALAGGAAAVRPLASVEPAVVAGAPAVVIEPHDEDEDTAEVHAA